MNDLSYQEKLSDERWIEKKREIIRKRGNQCEICFISNLKELHLHHNTYIQGREPWEYKDKELTLLCEKCHEKIHKNIGEKAFLIICEDQDFNWIDIESLTNGQDPIENQNAILHLTKEILENKLKQNHSILIIEIASHYTMIAELFFCANSDKHNIKKKQIGPCATRIWES